jgi:hypothetical protein
MKLRQAAKMHWTAMMKRRWAKKTRGTIPRQRPTGRRKGGKELLMKRNSQAMLARLRGSELPTIRRVVALIDRHNGGLEQEALLIPM